MDTGYQNEYCSHLAKQVSSVGQTTVLTQLLIGTLTPVKFLEVNSEYLNTTFTKKYDVERNLEVESTEMSVWSAWRLEKMQYMPSLSERK